VAMGAVFTAAARAPLTALASVVEMTGDFTLTLPVMLAVAIATTISRGLSYGTIYTTKLLRRGTDLDKTTPWRALQDVKLADAMRPLPEPLSVAGAGDLSVTGADLAASLPGQISHERTPQALYATESLSQALRQLILYGRDGLPVLSPDGSAVEGWLTNAGAMHAIARNLGAAADASRAELEAELAAAHQNADSADSPNPLPGFHIIEVLLDEHSPAVGRPLGSIPWPHGHIPVSVLRRRVLHEADPRLTLTAGDRVNLLTKRHSGDEGRGEYSDAPLTSDNAGSG
jgi:chloride channel protein, CIC family